MGAMRILILGGTVFLGRAVTDAALAAGHAVTHFNRGQSAAPDPRVESIVGDRTVAASFEPGKGDNRWDAVIDTRRPAAGGAAIGEHARNRPTGTFSCRRSPYSGPASPRIPGIARADPLPGVKTPENYGPLRGPRVRGRGARRVRRPRHRRAPGAHRRPHDPTDRFTWWLERVTLGGRVAAPGARRARCSSSTCATWRWMVALLEDDVHGTFNATGPGAAGHHAAVPRALRAVAGNDAQLVWIDEAFLATQKVIPWKRHAAVASRDRQVDRAAQAACRSSAASPPGSCSGRCGDHRGHAAVGPQPPARARMAGGIARRTRAGVAGGIRREPLGKAGRFPYRPPRSGRSSDVSQTLKLLDGEIDPTLPVASMILACRRCCPRKMP